MGRTYLITGGSASGKSRWAISYFKHCDNVLYINTGDKLDEDTAHRLEYSNKTTGVKWDVLNQKKNPVTAIKSDHLLYIFDGLAGYTQNMIMDMCYDPEHITPEQSKEVEKKVISEITEMMNKVNEVDGNLIIITVETGFSVRPNVKSQMAFRDILGAVNQRVANTADEVYMSISGIQMQIK